MYVDIHIHIHNTYIDKHMQRPPRMQNPENPHVSSPSSQQGTSSMAWSFAWALVSPSGTLKPERAASPFFGTSHTCGEYEGVSGYKLVIPRHVSVFITAMTRVHGD